MSKLLLSKTLKADYADPTSVPHCALANRMGERDQEINHNQMRELNLCL